MTCGTHSQNVTFSKNFYKRNFYLLVRKETAAVFEILMKQINQLCGKNMAYFKIRSYKQEIPSFKQLISSSNIDKTLCVKLGIIYPSLTTHNFRPQRPLSAITIKINRKN